MSPEAKSGARVPQTPIYADDLRRAVEDAAPKLLQLSEEQAKRRPRPEKWSPAEIIGHLIDSASNNHQRFVRAQFQDDLVFPGYDQDAWVAFQAYRDAQWSDLVTLWKNFNLHIARVMENTPEFTRNSPRRKHNLDKLAWRPVPADQPATLDYFMSDYVDHLKHHLRQIFPD
ncbi:MAG TPA: DinB family protein [Gemmatimonadaceae bacterium]|nr:DinB family protein [Gemmatimonadaceae bacterium]